MDYDYETEADFRDDVEMGWHARENQVEHKCEGCGCTFRAHYGRGDLAYCGECADRRERAGC